MDMFEHQSSSLGAACDYPAWRPKLNVRLTVLPTHPCAYLPPRIAQSRALWAEKMHGLNYHALMDSGFRRSGKLMYQPICGGCRACLPIRVPVAQFSPTKSQRRCVRKNADVSLTIGPLQSSDEKWELYRRYQARWHGAASEEREGFESFLYESPVDTVEFVHRNATGKLLGVGICDICNLSLSSVYFYFDPDESERGLGTYGAIRELEFAAAQNIPHYYLGYWIDRCPSMSYKANYHAHEILCPDGVWRTGGIETL